jgi:hypothetical protein
LEVSVHRADPTTWLDVFTAFSPLLGGLLGALIAVGGVLLTIRYTNQRELDRQDHERRLKDAELEANKDQRFRDERIAAYRKLLAATATAHHDIEAVAALAAAYAEISMLASTDAIDRAADKVWVAYGRAQEASEKLQRDPETPTSEYAQALNEASTARDEFLVLAHEELGAKGRTAGFHDLEGDDAGDALPDSEPPSSQHQQAQRPTEGVGHDASTLREWTGDVEARRRPWWRRWFGG